MLPADFWTFNVAVVVAIASAIISLASAIFTGWRFFSDRRATRQNSAQAHATAQQAVRSWVDPSTGQLSVMNIRTSPITGVQVAWAGKDKFPCVFVLPLLASGDTHTFALNEVPAGVEAVIDFSIESGQVWRVLPGRIRGADLPVAEQVTFKKRR